MKSYWLCAYGHVVRVSNRVDTREIAARECFGVPDGVTTIKVTGKGWRYLPTARRAKLLQSLGSKHYERTGDRIDGCKAEWYEVISLRKLDDTRPVWIVGPFNKAREAIAFQDEQNDKKPDGVSEWLTVTWFGTSRKGRFTVVKTPEEYKRAYPQ